MIISKRKLMTVLIMIMLLNIPYIRQTYNNVINLCIQIIIIFIYLSLNKKEKNNIERGIVFFSIGNIFSTIINFGFSTRLATAIVTSMEYILMFIVFKDVVKRHGMQYLIDIIFNFLKYMLIIVDIFIIFTRGNGYGGTGVLPYYLIGNKFAISYYHMLFIGIVYYRASLINKKNKVNIILILFSMFICKMVDCNTGLIGSFAVGGICLLANNNEMFAKLIQTPSFYIGFIIIINFLLIGTDALLNNEFVKRIVEDVLKRNMTLTGRLEMFELSWNAFLDRMWFGYGINSTYVEDVLGFGNAQNGILKILLDYGAVGFVLFIYVCIDSLKTKDRKISFIIAFLFGMGICSTVEINISGLFFLGLSIINASKYSEDYSNTFLNEKLYRRS